MSCIQVLYDEHEHIRRLLKVIEAMLEGLLRGSAADQEDFAKVIFFIRQFADRLHHGKEEDFLFKIMLEEMPSLAGPLIQNGMLVEHNLARSHTFDLETAVAAYAVEPSVSNRLNVVVAAGSYRVLLDRHMNKEDTAVFTFAEKNLSASARQKLVGALSAFEANPEHQVLKATCLNDLNRLEQRYLKQ